MAKKLDGGFMRAKRHQWVVGRETKHMRYQHGRESTGDKRVQGEWR